MTSPPIDASALAGAVDRLAGLEATNLAPVLQQVVDAVTEVFSSGGAGIMLLDEDSVLRYAAASDASAQVLERVQVELGHGPCVDALIHDHVVVTDDLTADARWPELGEVIEATSVRAVLGLPVHVGGTAVGSLDVYHAQAHHWTEAEREALLAFNRIVESLVGTALLADQKSTLALQLQKALDNRVLIERAVGVIMAVEQLDATDAFDRLRRVARSHRQPAVEVARDVLIRLSLPPT